MMSSNHVKVKEMSMNCTEKVFNKIYQINMNVCGINADYINYYMYVFGKPHLRSRVYLFLDVSIGSML